MIGAGLRAPVLAPIVDALVAARNPDGGWGAGAGRSSNTEATALGLLALHAAGREGTAEAAAWLVSRQREDGSWAFDDVVPDASWSGSLAVFALGRTGADEAGAARGLRWLVGQEGSSFPFLIWLRYKLFPEDQAVELDPSLTGWPWTPDTFSWVEPTSYALLALKCLPGLAPRRAARARIQEGERMILDRACRGGGWNYGNSRVLDEELEPYPDTTAIALLALQDQPRLEGVRAGMTALRRMLGEVDSGLALALATLCFRAHDLDASTLARRLGARFEAAGFLGETRVLALAALALADTSPFTLPRDG